MKPGMEAAISRRICSTIGLTLLVISGLVQTGCGTVRNTNTPRTGTEQLLLSSSFDEALRRIDFSPLANAPVFFETKNIEAVDKGLIISGIREAMLVRGVRLVEKPEQATVIVEARVGAYGTDDNSFMIGIPQMTIPVTMVGLPTGTVPEMALMKKNDQKAASRLALFAYDRANGGMVWTSGTSTGFANSKNLFIGGLGPIQSGSHKKNAEFMGVTIPQMTVQPVPIPILPWPGTEPAEGASMAGKEASKGDAPTDTAVRPIPLRNLPTGNLDDQEPGTVVPIPIPLPTPAGSPFSLNLFNGFARKDRGLLQSKSVSGATTSDASASDGEKPAP